MTDYEKATIIIACVSLLVAGSSAAVSLVALSRTSQGTKLIHAQVESQIHGSISSAQNRVADFTIAHGAFFDRPEDSLSDPEKKERERLEKAAKVNLAGYVNEFELACGKYIDGKVDKTRFKKTYQDDLARLVRDPAHKEFFKVGHSYHAIMRVFNEWENKEV